MKLYNFPLSMSNIKPVFKSGKETNKQTKHPTSLKLIPQEVGIHVLYLNGSTYKNISDANNPHYMRYRNSQPGLGLNRGCELHFAFCTTTKSTRNADSSRNSV